MISGNTTASELEMIVLSCRVLANPKPTITWLKRETGELRVLTNSSRISVSSTEDANVYSHSGTIVIQRVQSIDSGEYLCEIDNSVTNFPIVSSTFVTVNGKYRHTKHSMDHLLNCT